MQPRDRAANLEFWSDRARRGELASAVDSDQPPPSFRSSRFARWSSRLAMPAAGKRARPIAAALLLAGLTAAWLVVGQSAPGPTPLAAVEPRADAAVTVTTPAPTSTVAPSTTVPVTTDCTGLSAARPAVRCVVDAVTLDIRLLSTTTVAAAYRQSAGAAVAARSGSAACARGVPDERAWSTAAAPINAVGRYRCRFEHGRAAIWWTHGARLLHAVAPDGDLAGLFEWWRSHPSE